MNRRYFLTLLTAAPFSLAFAKTSVWQKSDAQWQAILTSAQFYILRQEGTERPFTSPLLNEKRTGVFSCAACALPLFESSKKYDSRTGWPSFFAALPRAVATKIDKSMGSVRTEYHCARCGGHQGHVFNDGPRPTGLRYCNNGVALRFIPVSRQS